MEEAMTEAREPFESAFEHAAIGMGFVAPDGHWLRVNRALCDALGYPEEELLGRTFGSIAHPDDLDAGHEKVRLLFSGGANSYQRETRYFRKDGQVAWALVSVSAVRGEDGAVRYLILQVQDITGRKASEEKLARLAYHDPLTGLPNRALLEERIERALERSRRTESAVAVLYLDLDGFKEVNDTLGHEAGDRLLVEFAGRIRLCSRPTDTVARLGGDEFCVLLEDLCEPREAAVVTERLREHLAAPTEVAGRSVRVGVSVGIATKGVHDEYRSVRQLLCEADAEMYRNKRDAKRHRRTTRRAVEPALGAACL